MDRRDNVAAHGWQAALKGWAAPYLHPTPMRPALPGQASWCLPRQEVTASRSCSSGRALARPLGPARHPSGPTTPQAGTETRPKLVEPLSTLGLVGFLPSLLRALLVLGLPAQPFSPQPSHESPPQLCPQLGVEWPGSRLQPSRARKEPGSW